MEMLDCHPAYVVIRQKPPVAERLSGVCYFPGLCYNGVGQTSFAVLELAARDVSGLLNRHKNPGSHVPGFFVYLAVAFYNQIMDNKYRRFLPRG